MVFRIAGGERVGFGHLRRSWTLAARLASGAAPVPVRFVVTSAEAAAALSPSGFPIEVDPDGEGLARATALLRCAPRPVVCVADDPELPAEGLAALRREAPVACLDDIGARGVPVDLVVNGSAGAEALTYQGLPVTRYRLGPRYILLRPAFALAPERPAYAETVRRVLVLTGGGTSRGRLQPILEVTRRSLPDAAVDVVLGPFAPPTGMAPDGADRVTFHQTPGDMRALMLQADVAISAAGQTAYELAATATPALGMLLADNQRLNLRGLSAAGAMKDLGAADDAGFPSRLAAALTALAHDAPARAAMGVAGRRLVDGQGIGRVATEILALASEGSMAEGTPLAVRHDGR
ncbi:MAG: hypothetical protein HYY91_00700 [Candidatus Omnitrophica bacterium]|nr:hypothetical protein [Candidatus Omnitrophota bacterium]